MDHVLSENGNQRNEVAKRVPVASVSLYDTKAINHMAEELGILGSVREVDEKVPSMLHRVFSHAPMVYLERLYSVIYELARQGNAVFLAGKSHPLARLSLCPARSGDGIAGDLHSTLMNQGLNGKRLPGRSDVVMTNGARSSNSLFGWTGRVPSAMTSFSTWTS